MKIFSCVSCFLPAGTFRPIWSHPGDDEPGSGQSGEQSTDALLYISVYTHCISTQRTTPAHRRPFSDTRPRDQKKQMSIRSVPQSPTQNVLLSSPRIQMEHHHAHRRHSLSPQLPISQRSNGGSFSSESTKSSKSPKTTRIITHLSLDMSRQPQDIQQVLAGNVEDSPQLLATSVGAEMGSELVPSISNISLLSLNQQQNTLTSQMLTDAYSADTVISSATANSQDMSSRFNTSSHRHLTLQRVPNSLPLQHTQFSIGSRKSSFNSPTLQSPQMFIPQTRSSLRRSSSNSFQQPPPQSVSSQYRSQQPKQPIQIKQRAINIDDSYAEPDSPALVPISLAGSPSNFLLSHSSPPNSYKAASLLPSISQPLPRNIGNSNGAANNYPLPSTILPQTATNRLFSSRPQSSQLKLSLNRFSDDYLPHPSLPLTRADSLTDSIGGRSPELAPVSSTLPPMTPLILSMPSELSSRSNSNVVVDDDCDDFNSGDSHHHSRSDGINDRNSFSSSSDKHIRTMEGTNHSTTMNDYNNSNISRVSTHTQKDEQDSFSQNDDIFGETIDD